MRRLIPPAAAAIALLALAAAASAHDLFLKLDSYFLPPNSEVAVRVLNGTFFKSENSIKRTRLRALTLAAGDSIAHLETSAWSDTSATSATLALRTGGAGTYVVGASTRPAHIALTGAEFTEYLEHDGIPDVLAARRRAGEMQKPARERYHKHVKAIFQVGATRTGDFDAVFGYPAELVPLSNPYSAKVGQTLRFRTLVDGQSVARQYVVAGLDPVRGKPVERGYRSDSAGVVRVPITRRGKWYVKFIHMAPVQDSVDYESKWASLTFQVR